jgi:NAD(P)-dependent dehydrogenase (short-subunit alcohol dehydrogenase family)
MNNQTVALTAAPTRIPLITKGGVHAFTTNLASELDEKYLRVNAVAPDIIRTPIHAGMDVDTLGSITLMNRVGVVEEISNASLHLASATFTTGVIMPVDGGYVHGRA